MTRLELLSADITEPLAQVYGAVTDPDRLATDLVLDATPRTYIDHAVYRSARDILLRRGVDPGARYSGPLVTVASGIRRSTRYGEPAEGPASDGGARADGTEGGACEWHDQERGKGAVPGLADAELHVVLMAEGWRDREADRIAGLASATANVGLVQ